MKFYVIENTSDGSIVGCETNLSHAKGIALHRKVIWGHECRINRVDVPVTTESIRLLLGNVGGYANEVQQVYPKEG